jgi:hypothetical protein
MRRSTAERWQEPEVPSEIAVGNEKLKEPSIKKRGRPKLKEVPKPVDLPSAEPELDIAALVKERQVAHDKVREYDARLKLADDDEKKQLRAERKQYVARVMEINADLAVSGKEIPSVIDYAEPELEVEVRPSDIIEETVVETELARAVREDRAAAQSKTAAPKDEMLRARTAVETEQWEQAQLDAAKALGIRYQELVELENRYHEMEKAAQGDPDFKTLFEANIDFSWQEFVAPPKKLFSFPNFKRQRMLNRLAKTYQEMQALSETRVQPKKKGKKM